MTSTRQLAWNAAAVAAHAFPVTYAHQTAPDSIYRCFTFREASIVLMRHRGESPSTPDDFTAHDAATGEWLGYGDTKEEAAGMAWYTLMDRSRREWEESHPVELPAEKDKVAA